MFDSSIPLYQEALAKSGYRHKLEYEPPTECTTKKKTRKKPAIWFNPHFSKNVKTNIGKEFLKLIHVAFPKSNPLQKNFTRQAL